MESNVPNAEAEAPKSAPSNQGRKRRRGKSSNSARVESHRETKGMKFEADRKRQIEARTGGFEADIPLPILAESATTIEKLSVEIPVSTRGVGFAVANCYEHLRALFPVKVPQLASIFQVYRASLLQAWIVQSQCQESRGKSTLNPDPIDDLVVPYELQLVRGYVRSFSLVANAISSFGWFEHEGVAYWPNVPPTPLYVDDTIIPRPCLVKAQELRNLVDQLADDDVPEEDREHFVSSNPLPGATYEDNLLTNADEVCPLGWPDRATARADLVALTALLDFAATKAEYLLGTLDYSGRGSSNALVSRRLQYADSAIVTGEQAVTTNFPALEDFYCGTSLDEQPFLRGAVSLAGEWEEVAEPPYRHEASAARRANLDWQRLVDRSLQRDRS